MDEQTAQDFWGQVGTRIDYRKDTVKTVSNRHLVDAIRQLHFFRYKTQEQQATYNALLAELQARQKAGTI
jgi:hypothetical protein